MRKEDWHRDEAQGQQYHLMMTRIKMVFAYFVDTKRETLMLRECGAFTGIRKHQNYIQNQTECVNLETNQRAPHLQVGSGKRQKPHLFFLASVLSSPPFSLQQWSKFPVSILPPLTYCVTSTYTHTHTERPVPSSMMNWDGLPLSQCVIATSVWPAVDIWRPRVIYIMHGEAGGRGVRRTREEGETGERERAREKEREGDKLQGEIEAWT